VHLNVLWIIRFCSQFSHHEIKQKIVIPTGIGLAAILGLEHCPDWLNCYIFYPPRYVPVVFLLQKLVAWSLRIVVFLLVIIKKFVKCACAVFGT